MSLKKPIIAEVLESDNFIQNLKKEIKNQALDDADLLLTYPIVYIHQWKRSHDNPDGRFDIYIGESNDVIQRTKNHYSESKDTSKWQHHLINDGVVPTMYIIGHEHFTKSLTLDIENRLINYVLGMNTVSRVHNSKGNPQNAYFCSNELDKVFSMIWRGLRKRNNELFISESSVKDSAIFKASPLHKLTSEQLEAKNAIINKVFDSIFNNKLNQLIFVQGEAGTGKTVLMSSTFYDLLENQRNMFSKPLKCALLVNHDEQITVYKEIAKKLNLFDEYGEDIISKPTHFVISHSEADPFDVVFVDEGHLLLTQGKQSYQGTNHLADIMKRSRITVLVFDENQILTTEEYWEPQDLEKIISLSSKQDNYILLKKQLRMQCSEETIAFIDEITLNQNISSFAGDPNYDIHVFDSPSDLKKAINKKASKASTKLSRMLATYDWDYSDTQIPPNSEKFWGVRIDDFFMPWNRELIKTLSKKQRRALKNLAWAEQPQTINEIGSTFTIQGFDLNYAGVIIGPSVSYKNGKIVFDGSKSKNSKAIRKRTLSNNMKKDFSEYLLKHELRVLLTRGVKGLYIFACDKSLNEALKKAINK